MKAIHPVTLRFENPAIERAFALRTLPGDCLQGRSAIAVGAIVYFLYGALDPLFITEDLLGPVWMIRLLAVAVSAAVLALSFLPLFAQAGQALLAVVGLTAAFGLFATLWWLPPGSGSYYFPGLLLAIFYAYNLIGLRFLWALLLNIATLLIFNLLFGYLRPLPAPTLLSMDFFMIAANLVGGTAGYLAELRRRQLFVRERQLDDERRRHLERALHDRLTGLPNRELLEDRIALALAVARRDGVRHAGFFIDLDGFKAVNDSLGHDRGDIALQEIARRLDATVRQSDTICRLGGDEFFVLVCETGTRERAAHLADKLIAAIAQPIMSLPGHPTLGASIGICLFPYGEFENTPAAIIRCADVAMYRAKVEGKACYRFADDV